MGNDSITTPGIYPGTSFAEYAAINALNFSTMKLFDYCPAKVAASRAKPWKVTKALEFGDAAHCAALEPKVFGETYCQGVTGDRRTKKVKDAEKKVLADNPGKALLTGADWEKATGIRDSLWRDRVTSDLLGGQGINEVSLVWTDPETGILCKARPDRITQLGQWSIIVDLKTTKDARAWSFGKAIHDYKYHIQAAWYLRGASVLAPLDRRHIIIAIEKEYPYLAKPYEIDGDSLDEGRALCDEYVKQYAACAEAGQWPGYSTEIEQIGIPAYGFKTEIENPLERFIT